MWPRMTAKTVLHICSDQENKVNFLEFNAERNMTPFKIVGSTISDGTCSELVTDRRYIWPTGKELGKLSCISQTE